MSDTNNKLLWKTVLGEIETEVSRANFLTLFRNTALLSIDETTAIIASSSTMTIDLLRKRFSPLIAKTLHKHLGREIVVAFVPKPVTFFRPAKEKGGPLFTQEQNAEEQKILSQKPQRFVTRVRAEYTFETMAVSSSNQLAFVSAQTVVKNLGRSYNPLFIYGPVGVGKTHLMQAIANEVVRQHAEKRIIYITSEEFTNEVVEAIRSNDTARMKKRFRTVDLLLIDDVQFIAGKDRVQEELFHTFNILIDNAAQIILSSDRQPHEIKKLEKRLSSRFAAGLTVDIEPPDFELKTAILLIKAKKYGVELPIEVAKIIAEETVDVRAIEGILLRIVTEAKTKNVPLSLELAMRVFSGQRGREQTRYHPDDIIRSVCAFYTIKTTQIKGPKRDALLVRARQAAMYLLKTELGLPYVEIGNLLGGRDHTTIIHGVGKIEDLLSSKARVSSEILGITKLLSEQKSQN